MTDNHYLTGTVVIPAYNEAGNIGSSLLRICEVLRADLGELAWDIVVVDDGSIDTTVNEAEATAEHPGCSGVTVRVLKHAANRGLGGALQTAFAASTGDVVVVVDCDLSYSPDHIPQLVAALRSYQAEVAIASPYMIGGSTVGVPRHIERRSRVANSFLSAAVNGEIATLTGMVRAYSGPFIRSLALKSLDAEINIEAIYKTQILRGRVVEVPATLDWSGLELRASRTRMTNPRTRSKIYNTVLNGILFRPYMIFALGGLILLGLGVAFGILAYVLPGDDIALTVFTMCSLTTGPMMLTAGLLSVQIKRCFEELFFLGSRVGPGNVAAAVTDQKADVPVTEPAFDVVRRSAPSSVR